MTKTVELLDAVPGCGKTYALLRYMIKHNSKPWLYISPLVKEVKLIVKEAEDLGVVFYAPTTDAEYNTLSASILDLLKQGVNIACTHELTHRFTREHLKYFQDSGYGVVCDETLSLIEPYKLSKDDREFLVKHNLISIEEQTGRVSFSDLEMGSGAKYSSFKKLCDIGCMYSARRSDKILVTQLSTDMLEMSSRFIVSTYMYEGSIMDVFLKLKGFTCVPLEGISTRKTNTEQKELIKKNLELVVTPGIQKIWDKGNYSMSSYWWLENSDVKEKQKKEVINSILYVKKKYKHTKTDYFFTMPMRALQGTKDFKPSASLSKDSWLACNTRATNEHAHKTTGVSVYNLFANQGVVSYIQDQGGIIDNNKFALSMLIQWLFRGCIRNGQPMKAVIVPERMHKLLKEWIES